MNKKIIIDKKTLEDLYIGKRLSTYQIAKKFNCDPTVIQNRLKENNVKLRRPKKRIDISRNNLKKLYWDKNLSSYKIAELLGIGRTTIYNKLVDYDIGTRPKKIVKISKKKLKELYIDKRFSLSKIAKLYNCSSSIILDRLKKYNIKRRDKYDANTIFIKKKFTGNKELKAYMIGFRLGDLNVKSHGPTVFVKSNTTKKDQYNLIKNVYGIYGHYKCKIREEVYNIWCNLDKSFSFLIPKEDKIGNWILNKDKFFFAFLGGYTDAEGNISVSQNRARFRIRTYDKNIIFQIYNKLNSLNINAKFGLVSKEGFHYGAKYNKDCWGIFVNSKESLFKLFKFLKPYLKHKKRYNDLILAEKNICERNKKHEIQFNLMENKKTFYVTTPIYYTNSNPHVGSVYTTIAADILARWNKLNGKEVFFLTGTDEHGQKIQRTAEKKGISPKKFVDEITEKFKEVFKLLNISNDNFIRTTDKYHEEEVKKILKRLYDKKLIYKGNYEAYYCVECEQYLTKRDLVDGKCFLHKTEPELRKEEAYLFKLSNFQDKLLKLIESGKFEILPKKKRKEIIFFIKQGLQDISISRLKEKVSWGIELPFDKKHTCFVWVDAFWNYISGLRIKGGFEKFWPADVQLMANDIFRVHATIWPALLLGLGYELPKTLFIHGYFTVNGQKMSKSLGNAIAPDKLVSKYGTDSVRYYLIRNIPFGEDGDFSEKVLVARNNNELANKLGNLVSRVSALAEKYGTEKTENKLLKKLNVKAIDKKIENYEFDKALNQIFSFIDICNEYVQRNKIWETKDKKALYELKESILKIAELLWPFIPESSEKITKQFSVKKIKKASPLFKKI